MIERILEIIKKNGLTNRSFCEKLNINVSAVTDWKSGKTKPSISQIIAIAQTFNVSTDYILLGSSESLINSQNFQNAFNNNKHSTITIQNGSTHTRELTELESELMKITSELPTKEKIKLVDYAYQLTDKKVN